MEPRNKDRQQAEQSQERNLRERTSKSPMDYENVPDPVSFEDEDLDREERDDPKGDDRDDINDSR